MDPYSMMQLASARHDDLVRDAEESRLAREVRDEAQHEPQPAPRGIPRLRIAG